MTKKIDYIKVFSYTALFLTIMTGIVYCIVENDFASKASNDGWLSYFGGLVSGMATLIAIFISVNYARNESEKHFDFLKIQAIQATLKTEYINLYDEVRKLECYIGSFGEPLTDMDVRYEWQGYKDFFPLEVYNNFNQYFKNNEMYFLQDSELIKLIEKINGELHNASSIALNGLEYPEEKKLFVENNLSEWLKIIEDIKYHISRMVTGYDVPLEK